MKNILALVSLLTLAKSEHHIFDLKKTAVNSGVYYYDNITMF